MPERTRKANRRKSKVRAFAEHVFARQKGPMGLVVRTVGIARAQVKIGMANLARLVWLREKKLPPRATLKGAQRRSKTSARAKTKALFRIRYGSVPFKPLRQAKISGYWRCPALFVEGTSLFADAASL